jgi:hypothetical protein
MTAKNKQRQQQQQRQLQGSFGFGLRPSLRMTVFWAGWRAEEIGAPVVRDCW